MLAFLWAKLLSRLFGEGIGADIAGRGAVYLAQEARKAVANDEVRLTKVRLRPGESYTVVARPRATRKERHLAGTQRSLRQRDRKLSRPSRRQLKAARKLERTQHRLDRRRPGTRRHERSLRKEHERGERFDRLMRPTRRQTKVRRELAEVTAELQASRDERYAEARARLRRPKRRVQRVKVYD